MTESNEAKAAGADLGMSAFFTRDRANEGIELPLYLPNGRKSEHWLRVLGVDSDAFRLAEAYGIVLLNGGGFEAPDWSLRVSLANLPDEAYEQIGRGVRLIARGYRDTYEASKLVPAK